MSDSVRPHRWQPTRLPLPWDSPGQNTGVGCHFLLQWWKWKVKVKSLSRVRLLATPRTAAHQAPPSMGFSRQEYCSGVPSLPLAPSMFPGVIWNTVLKAFDNQCLKSFILSQPSKRLSLLALTPTPGLYFPFDNVVGEIMCCLIIWLWKSDCETVTEHSLSGKYFGSLFKNLHSY